MTDNILVFPSRRAYLESAKTLDRNAMIAALNKADADARAAFAAAGGNAALQAAEEAYERFQAAVYQGQAAFDAAGGNAVADTLSELDPEAYRAWDELAATEVPYPPRPRPAARFQTYRPPESEDFPPF